MKIAALWISVAVVVAQTAAASSLTTDGTVCRMNRSIDRMILLTDAGPRIRVALGRAVPIRFNAKTYDRNDLRPGDRVHVVADRGTAGLLARQVDLTMRVGDALVDSIFRTHHTTIGRFAVREAKTEFFSLRLPELHYVRVDAKAAYGPGGRVWVSSLKPGDLLEIRGTWASKDLLKASSIEVVTDREPSFCRTAARRGELSDDTQAREADERKFLNKSDD
ncbi:MAG: hypothetical protein M3041_01785 [Acidobacteriota bacterium]|nr:hypothetical protein [Acidobacteriota bacterium]